MAKETVQSNLPQSCHDSIESSPSEETNQDRLRSQNAALNTEIVQLQKESAKLETLLSAHTLGRDCRLCHQQQAPYTPESETAIKTRVTRREHEIRLDKV
ncbi:hypothetical protein H9L39_17664 [Fusarium oxysporum f. sp. albedinis]|nr:hypothetical protein H9L39_17664 [Fusarium oxysporum f. sp. albedinis]